MVACRLGNSDADVLTLSSADRAAYLRTRQLLDLIGVAIEAAAQFAEAKKALGETPLFHAVEFYLKRHPTKMQEKRVAVVAAEFREAKRIDGLSDRYLQCLRYCMGKFETAFQCNIAAVTSAGIDDWLRKPELSPRSRNNLRNAVQTLFSFAKGRAYLPKDHQNIYLLAGHLDQRFTLDRGSSLTNWVTGYPLEFLDGTGTLLLIEPPNTNAPPFEFFRATLAP